MISNRLQVCALVLALGLNVSDLMGQSNAGLSNATLTSPPAVRVTAVPALSSFSGKLTNVSGTPISTVTGVTFALYKEFEGGAPLWIEVQNVQPDRTGRYIVALGSTTSGGLPADLFVSGEARWLGVQAQGQTEQPRVLLLSVPYAMKAADAETLGGYPLSAFMLAAPLSSRGSISTPPVTGPTPSLPPATVSGGGTPNFVPLWTTATNLGNSAFVQTGTGATAKIGIATTTPAATLDVKGTETVRGVFTLPAKTAATGAKGSTSEPLSLVASSFNSGSATAVNEYFNWQAEATGNNTTAPSATLNLLFGAAGSTPAETGLKVSSKGIVGFAAGQIFPGTGKGTITGVAPGTGLLGGGTTGTVTLNLDTTKVPLLTGSNNFTAPQDFKANVGIGIGPSGAGYTPLTVGGTTTFGTWMAISNTSAGGHTWNIISAGSGNAEGAGNLGITDLTGKSTIWLEGNTNTANLTATGTVGAAALVVSSTAGAAIIDADGFGQNAGGPTPGLRFGGGASGEGIASNRTVGLTQFGLDFYTDATRRMTIFNDGQIAVGTASPGAQLGVVGSSNAFPAIYAQAGAASNGSGQNGSDGIDALGGSDDLSAKSASGGAGIQAFGGQGLNFGGVGGVFRGASSSDPFGVGDGIIASAGGPTGEFGAVAGDFTGDINVNGTVFNDSVLTRVDHPLDPANKYLIHSSVESSEMKNIYDGNVTTDTSGRAVVELPDWFEAMNRDFRYQLTTIGQPAQAWISSKITNHAFTINTDKPNVEISWQVTGIRRDAYANAHRIPVEVVKPDRERGHYVHPELYGAPEEASIEWARHPQLMKKLKEIRLQQAAHRTASASASVAVSKPKKSVTLSR
jgi:trimeric autotransporter adhesin